MLQVHVCAEAELSDQPFQLGALGAVSHDAAVHVDPSAVELCAGTDEGFETLLGHEPAHAQDTARHGRSFQPGEAPEVDTVAADPDPSRVDVDDVLEVPPVGLRARHHEGGGSGSRGHAVDVGGVQVLGVGGEAEWCSGDQMGQMGFRCRYVDEVRMDMHRPEASDRVEQQEGLEKMAHGRP